jgi:hypothetical protein
VAETSAAASPKASVNAPMRPNSIRQHWQRMHTASSQCAWCHHAAHALSLFVMGYLLRALWREAEPWTFLEALQVGLLCGGKAGVSKTWR